MEKKARISFEHNKFTAWYKELDSYTKQTQNVLDRYVDKGIIKKADIIPELAKALFRQDFSLLREIVRERGLQGAKTASYAMERVISREVQEMEKQVRNDLLFLNAAQMLSDWREKIDFVTAKDGVVCVDVEALREYLSTYMIIDDETQELIDRARKLWEELKQLDSDLQNASIEANAKVRLLGNEYDTNSLISVSDSENVLFDEKVFSGTNGNIHNTIDNPQKGWIVRDLEG